MGSKKDLLEFVTSNIRAIHENETICDLFAGTSIIGAALKQEADIWSNDIQSYSGLLAGAYLASIDKRKYSDVLSEVTNLAEGHVAKLAEEFPNILFQYESDPTLETFQKIEKDQQALINDDFHNHEYTLFTKCYSGTYWSSTQCMWIDAYKYAADHFKNSAIYPILMSSLMHAMAYNSQSTGHYAQYRDANTLGSMEDIMIYRKKSIKPYFEKKYKQLFDYSTVHDRSHIVSDLDYKECLVSLPDHSLVYADPPYAFVHYSRFYHTLETLVHYDYPEVKFKGRYRVDRHQSPFCQKSNVRLAFSELFNRVESKKHKLVLSYSNTGMITLENIISLANQATTNYSIHVKDQSYVHSTMGRSKDKSRNVNEHLVILQPK